MRSGARSLQLKLIDLDKDWLTLPESRGKEEMVSREASKTDVQRSAQSQSLVALVVLICFACAIAAMALVALTNGSIEGCRLILGFGVLVLLILVTAGKLAVMKGLLAIFKPGLLQLLQGADMDSQPRKEGPLSKGSCM